jgi:hypothetical protein
LTLFAKFGFATVMPSLLLGLALQAPVSAEIADKLTLKSVVQVATDEVMLRDLVKGDGAGLQEDLVICHAPEVGSVRTLSMVEVAAVLKKYDVQYLLQGPAQISLMRVGRKLTPADLKPLISAALVKEDASLIVGDVQLQAAIFVNETKGVRLHKLRFDPRINRYRAWFVASDAPNAPIFEATASLDHGAAPQEITLSKTGRSSSASLPQLRRGQTAAMQLSGDGFNATLTVICLEDGMEANTIKVREPSSKRIYQARIVGPGLLQAVGREK